MEGIFNRVSEMKLLGFQRRFRQQGLGVGIVYIIDDLIGLHMNLYRMQEASLLIKHRISAYWEVEKIEESEIGGVGKV